MRAPPAIVPRLELALILLMCAGFLLVVQQWSFVLYQGGILTVMLAAILNIAVGNLPRQAGALRAAVLTVGILGLVAGVFLAGILLVPYLAEMGQ
jgi:uncharacterized protein YqgC (DUF456 family)